MRLENKKSIELHNLYYTPYSIHPIKPRVTICAGHAAFVVFNGKCTQIACDEPRRKRDLMKSRPHTIKVLTVTEYVCEGILCWFRHHVFINVLYIKAWTELQYTVECQIHLLLINCYICFLL